MTCIVCGTRQGDEYYCSIRDMAVCFCEKHFEEREEYDCVIIRQRPLSIPVAVS